MEKDEFKTIKGGYEKAREEERSDLARFLSLQEGIAEVLRVVSGGRAGKGMKNYTSRKRIETYDLSNWKWVEITDDRDFECIVSLNMSDVDPRSGNSHALFDRVGLLVFYHKNGHYYETVIYTDIDLPLDEKEKAQIAQLVREQYDTYCEGKKEGDLTDEKIT